MKNLISVNNHRLKHLIKSYSVYIPVFIGFIFLYLSCEKTESYERFDNAMKLEIPVSGSLQNPAFSPDGEVIVFTRFSNGYNIEPADIYTYNLNNGNLHLLVSDGSANVNLPGSCWNLKTESIVFSSSRDPHDEIFVIDDNGNPGDELQITSRSGYMAYEPSFSPDGDWIVYESHPVDVEGQGIIMKHKVDNSIKYLALTDAGDDCRQPNWSPSGNFILFQKYENNQWDIWIMNHDGSGKTKVTSGEGDKTDACFTHDGKFILYSSDFDLKYANIFKIPVNGGNPVRMTSYGGYDGAPSVSPDGSKLVFESYGGDPDDSEGTTIWISDIN